MKALIIICFLLLSLQSVAYPGMRQVDHTERKGFKINMMTDQQPSGIMHQHQDSNEARIAGTQKPAKLKKLPSQAHKKGHIHK